jgi:hypothetical protein
MLGDGRLGLVDARIEPGPVPEGLFEKCAQRPRQAQCEHRGGLVQELQRGAKLLDPPGQCDAELEQGAAQAVDERDRAKAFEGQPRPEPD